MGQRPLPPNDPQQVHRFRAGKLLANESRDESAASDLASSLHAPEHHQQLPPPWRQRLAGEQIAEHHTPSVQQLFREPGDRGVVTRWSPAVVDCLFGRLSKIDLFERRPSSGGMPWPSGTPATFAPTTLRVDQGTEIVESVSRDQPGRDQLPEPVFNLTR